MMTHIPQFSQTQVLRNPTRFPGVPNNDIGDQCPFSEDPVLGIGDVKDDYSLFSILESASKMCFKNTSSRGQNTSAVISVGESSSAENSVGAVTIGAGAGGHYKVPTFDPNQKQPMTTQVVTLWYRPPEFLLGATENGVGVDLCSAGCILDELLAGKPIMPGRTEVEQLHKIFKLCGSHSDEY